MPDTELLRSLGLKQTPFFGDLAKRKSRLRNLFRFRNDIVEATVRRVNSGVDSRIVLVTGAPGVGKSTFLEFLSRIKFPKKFKRISLASRLDAITEYDYAEINSEQILYVFRRIESFLLEIIQSHKIDLPSRHKDGHTKLDNHEAFSKFTSGGEGSEERRDERLSIVIELVRDYIIPLCVKISDAEIGDKYCLAIDDVDYIFPHHQTDILRLLVSMVEVTDNPIIFYSARPVAGMIAQSYIARFFHHHTSGAPINLNPLPVMAVIDSRFEDASIDGASFFNILGDQKVRSIIEGLSSSNIRAALKYAELCYLEYPQFNKGVIKKFDADTIIRILYGDPTVDKDSSSSGDQLHGPLINILRSMRPGDPLPYEFVALFSLIQPRMIDAEFYRYFNDNCLKINPKEHKRQISDADILRILRVCHQEDLVSQATHINFDDIPRNFEAYSYRNRLEGHTLELTIRGKFLLEMAGEPLYQELAALDSWRRLVSDNVRVFSHRRAVKSEDFL